jgi:hypothetical protein
MPVIRSFLVRIYRRDQQDVAGWVEHIQSGKTRFFGSFRDLRAILSASPRRPLSPAVDASTKALPPR